MWIFAAQFLQTQQHQKWRRAFEARRNAIERIGLPQVRNHRMGELVQEETEWKNRIEEQAIAKYNQRKQG